MSGINVPTYFTQQYSTNIELLLQIMGSKLSGAVDTGSHVGKQASPVDQMGAIEASKVTSRFGPMGRVDPPTDRRWVFPVDYDLPQLFDNFDKLKMILDPKSKAVQNAVLALGRKKDVEILAAFFGTAKTGENGSINTIYPVANTVAVSVGGANSRINVAKLLELKELMQANFVDFDREEVFVGLTAKDHSALLNEVQIISSDFNGGDRPVLKDGKVESFLGFKFIMAQAIETELAGVNEVALPAWAKSGMHLGQWNDITNSISQRNDLTSEPWQAYTYMTVGATRTEENKIYQIKSFR